MKKVILLSAALSFFAATSAFSSLSINIYNNSRYNCDLLSNDTKIYHGHFDSLPPAYLAPGSSRRFYLSKKGRHAASVYLTYQCEGDHKITIFSRLIKRHGSGRVEVATNMEGFVRSGHGKMTWTLQATN